MPLSPELRSALEAVADPDGFVRFDRFVDVALYHPTVGYYAAHAARTGPAGDFYTAAQTGPLLARSLARRIEAEHRRLGSPRHFTIVELGPGETPLAVGLLGPRGLALAEATELRVVLVERTAARRAAALATTRGALGERPVDVTTAPGVAALGPFAGVIVGNELLDALPFRRLVWRNVRWNELGVELEGEGLAWAESVGAIPVAGTPLPAAAADGTVLELPLAAEALMREIGDHLTAGAALFLDYGDEEAALLARQPGGTLAAYRRHEPVDPLAAPGEADLSAFVNFSRVRAAARAAGLRETAYEPQAPALGRWGLGAELDAAVLAAGSPGAEVRARLGAKSLAFGFESFRALELAAG